MRIVHLVENLDERYGGPAHSVPQLAAALANQGVKVTLKSLTWGAEEQNPEIDRLHLSWQRYRLDWPRKLMVSRELYGAIQPKAGEQMVLHVHNLWNGIVVAAYLRAHRYGIPLVISPRGSLYPWSLSQGKWRKAFAWRLFQKHILNAAGLVHATAQDEMNAIRHLDIEAPIALVPNGIDIDISGIKRELLPDRKRHFLFMSRLHPKKGIDVLLRAWAGSQAARTGCVLTIAGSAADPDYERGLIILARQLRLDGSVRFIGWISGRRKRAVFADADVFVLPSHTENFGVAVAEALAHGIPVITTTGTPWAEVASEKAGWWIKLSEENLRATLDEAAMCDLRRLAVMGARGRDIAARYSWEEQARNMLWAYQWVLGKESKPPHVFESLGTR